MDDRQCEKVSVDNNDIQALILDMCIDVIDKPYSDNGDTIGKLCEVIRIYQETGKPDLHLSITMMLEYILLFYIDRSEISPITRVTLESIIQHNVITDLGNMRRCNETSNKCDDTTKSCGPDNKKYTARWRLPEAYRNGDIIEKYTQNPMYNAEFTTLLLGSATSLFSPIICHDKGKMKSILDDSIVKNKFAHGMIHYRIPEE